MATVVTKTVKPSGGDYTSLSAWEAGEQRDLVTLDEIAQAECYSMSDRTYVTIDGWTTDATHYIRIYTPTTERHNGKWDATKYLIDQASYWATIEILEDYVRLEGLQGTNTSTTGWANVFHYSGLGECTISHCVVKGSNLGATNQSLIETDKSGAVLKVYNCIGYDSINRSVRSYKSTVYLYNSTFYNATNYGVRSDSAIGGGGHIYVTNCAVFNNLDDFYKSGGGGLTVDHCASDDGDGTNAVIPADWNNVFVDIAGRDFHLKSTDTDLKDAGTDLSADPNLSFTDDIDGETRSGTWDIGADEYVTTGGGPQPLSGSITGTSSLSGLAGLNRPFSGSIAGLSSLSGLAGLGKAFGGSLSGLTSAAAGLVVTYGLGGGTSGMASLSGTLTPTGLLALAGIINGLSTMSGGSTVNLELGGMLPGLAGISAYLSADYSLQGNIPGVSFISGTATGGTVRPDGFVPLICSEKRVGKTAPDGSSHNKVVRR